ncbi:hypothetical protein [Hoeflea sp. EC-HK425]|uniref:hypothetical protein n=1 Tax=Hoeflea sp. EC-HK425 TaxID=2038388 RepID=UPI001259E454|nr:hypothetical protein [Hoeflea sp. EC-HK425]VVT28222.1 conserved hypothetical protein [Hoeflea sp. EC-HK425]
MAKYAVLGVTGEDGYWMVDFDAGTVSALPPLDADPFGYSAAARQVGATMTAGIDLAVVVSDRDAAFSGQLDAKAFSGQLDAGSSSSK